MEFVSEFQEAPQKGLLVPLQLLQFATGPIGNQKILFVCTQVKYKMSIKSYSHTHAIVFGKTWENFVLSKNIVYGWNINFCYIRKDYVIMSCYNLEGNCVDRLWNYRGRDHSCVSLVSKLSNEIHIFSKGYFDMLNHCLPMRMNVISSNANVLVDGHIINNVVYGFEGLSWELLFEAENISVGQKMVLCYIKHGTFSLTLFNEVGVQIDGRQLAVDDITFADFLEIQMVRMVLFQDSEDIIEGIQLSLEVAVANMGIHE